MYVLENPYFTRHNEVTEVGIMSKKMKDSIVIGLALFAMFFGAGNLIFPPQIGIYTGSDFALAALGFFFTGIGLPLIGIIAAVKAGEALKHFQKRIGKMPVILFQLTIALTLGLVAIPRTAATTHEMGFDMFFNGISPVVTSSIFFGITIALAIKPTGIVDRIGKFLTPVLVLFIGGIIIKGIIDPVQSAQAGFEGSAIAEGFLGGYQTMDALGALIFGGIVLNTLNEKGYTSRRDQMKMTITAGIVAALGLALVYGGLMYLGSQMNGIADQAMSKTALTILIANTLLGRTGTWMLGLAVSFACLTTSIGLVATMADYFSDITKGKIAYKWSVILISVISGSISILGVDQIVTLAIPILVVLYPVAILLVLFILLDDIISKSLKGYIDDSIKMEEKYGYAIIYKVTFLVTLLFGILQGMKEAGIFVEQVDKIMDIVPLGTLGFPWVVPTLITFIIAYTIIAISYSRKKRIRTKVGEATTKLQSFSR